MFIQCDDDYNSQGTHMLQLVTKHRIIVTQTQECNKMIQLNCLRTQNKCHAEVIVILFISDYFIRKLLLYLNITLCCHSGRTLLNVITICLSSLIRDSTQCLNINNDENIITILTQQTRAKLLFFKSYHSHYLYLLLLPQIFCVMRCCDVLILFMFW